MSDLKLPTSFDKMIDFLYEVQNMADATAKAEVLWPALNRVLAQQKPGRNAESLLGRARWLQNIMKTAQNRGTDRLMSVWDDDVKTIDDIVDYLNCAPAERSATKLPEESELPRYPSNEAREWASDAITAMSEEHYGEEKSYLLAQYFHLAFASCSSPAVKESQAKEPEASGGLCADAPHAVRVGVSGADQTATSEHMDVTAGETAPSPVVWIAFADNGNVRFWTADPKRALMEKMAQGLDVRDFSLAELIGLISRRSQPEINTVSIDFMQRVWANLYYNEEEAGNTFQNTLNEVADWLAARCALPAVTSTEGRDV